MTRDLVRRDFFKAAAASLAATAWGSAALAAQEEGPEGIPKRPLGKTGEKVSIIGMGGFHIRTIRDDKQAIAVVHEAIDRGVTFFDNAWDYHNGGSEELMGKALASAGRRDKVFLMTKVCARDYEGVRKQIDESLRRLQTDRLDLLQFHEVNFPDAPDWIFDKGGIRAAAEARQAGKVRFLGFTGHKDPQLHLRMLGKDFPWDTCQMPINILDAHYKSFQKQVVPVCNQRQIGVIGMKALASGTLPKEVRLDATLCRRYSLSLPISTLVCGIASREDLQQDLALALHFKPLTPTDLAAFLAKTESAGSQGR